LQGRQPRDIKLAAALAPAMALEEGCRKKVLIVDDDADNRRIVAKVLLAEGYQVIEAGDGLEAVAQARAQHPDLIFMDLSLPLLDGWEATRQLKVDPATQAIPIVALTAFAMRGDEEEARAAGCDDYLSKPVRPAAIRDVTRKYTNGATPGVA